MSIFLYAKNKTAATHHYNENQSCMCSQHDYNKYVKRFMLWQAKYPLQTFQKTDIIRSIASRPSNGSLQTFCATLSS